MRKLQNLLLITAAVALSSCNCCHTPVNTYAEPNDPTPLTQEAVEAWGATGKGLHAAWGSANLQYPRSEVPSLDTPAMLSLCGWRGEKVAAQLLLWSADGADGTECKIKDLQSESATLPADIAQARFVRYTIGDKSHPECRCARSILHEPALEADMLDSLKSFDIAPKTTRPVWITIDIPKDAVSDVYHSEVVISHNGFGKITLPFELKIINQVVEDPSEWQYHLDLWQHPSAIARMHNVVCWSDEHFELMRKEFAPLVAAGQKVVTATLNRDPWRYQCFDDYEAMIAWTLNKDGSWSYDYTIFDRWVEFMFSLGIDRSINCYSMLPWGECELDYFDADRERNRVVKAIPGTPEFEKMWAPFLADFAKHLAEKGWLHKTNMAIDERAPEDMKAAARLIAKHAPQLGFAIADNHNSYKNFTNMRDVCVSQKNALVEHSDILERREKGFYTTFYICCSTHFPNAFTYSQPFEAELLGWYGVAHDYDGMLRWAYNSWPAAPHTDARFRRWASGDTFFIYPHARTTMRFERLVDGIEVAEKIRSLRRIYGAENEALKPIEAILEQIRTSNVNDPSLPWAEFVDTANHTLNDVAEKLAQSK
ncbi:MAG: DUF4091 domain-containing protein [Alistipes sp.]|nr:DUF4091 domain-containing protein [Alistipes sp.]